MLTHTVCEICGKSETAITYTGNTNRTKPNRLCIDHDHSTKNSEDFFVYHVILN